MSRAIFARSSYESTKYGCAISSVKPCASSSLRHKVFTLSPTGYEFKCERRVVYDCNDSPSSRWVENNNDLTIAFTFVLEHRLCLGGVFFDHLDACLLHQSYRLE